MKKWITGLAVAIMVCLYGMTALAAEPTEILTFEGFLSDLSEALNARFDYVSQTADGSIVEEERAIQTVKKEWEIKFDFIINYFQK